jgi:hypothetical protein
MMLRLLYLLFCQVLRWLALLAVDFLHRGHGVAAAAVRAVCDRVRVACGAFALNRRPAAGTRLCAAV